MHVRSVWRTITVSWHQYTCIIVLDIHARLYIECICCVYRCWFVQFFSFLPTAFHCVFACAAAFSILYLYIKKTTDKLQIHRRKRMRRCLYARQYLLLPTSLVCIFYKLDTHHGSRTWLWSFNSMHFVDACANWMHPIHLHSCKFQCIENIGDVDVFRRAIHKNVGTSFGDLVGH